MSAMRLYAVLIYVFLYAPIAFIVVFSFNAGRYAMDWQGFSTAMVRPGLRRTR